MVTQTTWSLIPLAGTLVLVAGSIYAFAWICGHGYRRGRGK